MFRGTALGRNKCLFSILMFTMVGGCGLKYRNDITSVTTPYKEGRFQEAEEHAAKIEDKGEARDKLALVLEEGQAMRANGSFEQSNQIFDRADQTFEAIDTGADVSISGETAGVVFSPAAMTYRGYGYDRIMINVDKAMNNMALGHTDAVRTEIVRLDASQQACERRYAKQIEELRKAQSDSKNVDSDPKKVGQDPKFQEGQAKVFEDFSDDSTLSTPLDDERYKYEYTNPFAEYLKSIFYSYSNEPGEAEQARVAMRHAAAMAPHNSFVTKDLDDVEFAANSEKVAPKTYVFFETGMAPTRKEIRIDLPIFIVNLTVKDTKVDYVGVAFPQLKRDDDFHRYLIASTTEANYKTETLADMDRIIAREFKHEMPVIITRLVVSQGLKVAAEVGTAEAVKNQNPLVQLAARAGVSGFNAATNEADLRTWHTLPKQIQIADFNTPANGVVRLAFPTGASAGTVNVTPGKANVIWIVNSSTQSQPTVRTFALQ